jgi:hypothetical protein
MSQGRFLKGSFLVFAAFLLVLLFLVLFSPRLTKTDWFQKHSLAHISGKFGGHLKWEGLKWTLFPAPRLELQEVSFERTGQVEARSAAVTVSPRLLSLLRGRIDPGRVVAEAPFIRIPAHENSQVLNPFKGGMAGLMGLRSSLGTDFSIHLRNGRVELPGEHDPPVVFEEINGQIGFSEKETRVSLKGMSGWLGEISIDGVFDPEAHSSKGKVVLQGFRPHRLFQALFPEMKTGLKDSLAQVTLHLEMDGAGNVALNGEGSVERLALAAGAQDVEIGFSKFSGSARIHGPDVSVALRQVLVDHDGGEISGTFALSQRDPRARVRLVGQGMDVGQVREVTLALFGKDKGVRAVFDVLREGRVPSVTLTTQGNDLRELTLLSNLTIRGELQEGTVYIRELDFDLRGVSGQAVIQNGLLEASNAQARLGTAAYGQNGGLTLGLDRRNDRFHLDVEVDADVGQFPVYLPRVLKNGGLQTELSLMSDLKGRASGRLVLGESLKAPRAAISVSWFNAAATYRRVPFPIQLSGGSIALTEEKMDFSHLRCVIGRSEFLDVGGYLRWDRAPFLDVHSTKAEAAMDEVSPWLHSQPALSGLFTHVRDMKGALLLNDMVLKGPLTAPGDWQLEMAGRMRDFSCEIAKVSERIGIREGEFSYLGGASSGRLFLGGARLLASDGALQTTGTVDYDLTSGFGADLSLKGELGNASMRELARLVGLPPEYVPGGPLSIPIARFWRSTDGTTRVSGDALLGGEVSISLECLVTKKRVTINNLVVRDGQSFAQVSLNWQERTVALAFKGDLEQHTFSKLLTSYGTGAGRLKGDFRAHIRLDRPLDSSIHGELTVDDFLIPWGPNGPVRISHCAIFGEEDLITLKSTSVVLNNIPFEITGDIRPLAGELFLDLDISAGRLVWPEVARIFGGDGLNGHRIWDSGPPDLPVRGTIRIQSDSLAYGRRNWVPFKAQLTITDGAWTVEVKETNLCGISMPGVLQFTATQPLLKVFPASQGQALNPAIQCLLGEHMSVTGHFDLSGHMEGNLKEAPFSKGLSGELSFHARDGRIYRYELLSKIFAFLNLTELLRGKVPDMGKEGFAYNAMHAKADLLNGRLVIKEAVIDGKSMEIGCEGEVDLLRDQVDLRVLVAPLKTVDFIIKHIPGVNYILGGTLVSIPVRVSGRLADPTITPLSPSAVGEGLLGIMERALTLPVKIIEPVLPETTK